MAVYKPRTEPIYKGDTFKQYIDITPSDDVYFFDISSLMKNPLVFQECVNQMVDIIQYYYFDHNIEVTGILSYEKCCAFSAPVAYKLGLPLVVTRDLNNSPNKTLSIEYKSEYNDTKCQLEIQEEDVQPSSKFIIIDNIINKGYFIEAMINLVRKRKFADILGVITLVNLNCGGSKLMKDIGVSLYSLIDYHF